MGDFITALMASFNIQSMWGVITAAGTLIGTLIIFGFGYRVVKRLVGGARKGTIKM